MRVLFVGLGSIGQRHLRNLKELANSELEIFVYRKTNHNLIIEDGLAVESDSLSKHYGYKQTSSLADGLACKPQIVFITNPTSEHIAVALACAKAGAHVFIEKPLSSNFDYIPEFLAIVEQNKLVVSVGYQTKYNPIFQNVMSLISERRFGNIISADFEWGTYLPDHHPYEDYRKGYAANASLGGGVTLGLIHEIDLIYSFFGVPEKIHTIGGNLSPLEMTAEDTVSALMRFDIDGKAVPVTLRLSYAQVHETRSFRIQFDKGFLICDLVANSLVVYGSKGKILLQEEYGSIDRNQMFKDQLVDFLGRVAREDRSLSSLQGGIETLSIALIIKEKIYGQNL